MIDPVVLDADWSIDQDELMRLRTEVFVIEQNVPPALEVDGRDPECRHAKALLGDQVVGTGRLLPTGYIGRMCIKKTCRGRGIGGLILENLVAQAVQDGHSSVFLNAQTSAIGFYRKHGFVVDSEEFIEAGIPHQRMSLELRNI